MDATIRRRWLGGLVLLGALLMLIAGQTLLKHRLRDVAFLVYWVVCLALTVLAIIIALLDATALQRRTRQENRELLKEALDEIEAQVRQRKSKPPGRREP